MPSWIGSPRSRADGSGFATRARWRPTASSSLPWRVEVGLFKELALLPLAPVRGTAWVAEQLAEEAERELYDENRIKREMLELEFEEEEGRISAAERERKEAELLERLQIARERDADQAERLDAALEAAETEDSEVIDRG